MLKNTQYIKKGLYEFLYYHIYNIETTAMQSLLANYNNYNEPIFSYWNRWKGLSSFKSLEKSDRKKLEEIIKSLKKLDEKSIEKEILFSKVAELYLALANDLIYLKWKKKDPKLRVDINLKCDSFFFKISQSINELTESLKSNLKEFHDNDLASDTLLILNDEFEKLTICNKIFYEYSVALNNGGELEE